MISLKPGFYCNQLAEKKILALKLYLSIYSEITCHMVACHMVACHMVACHTVDLLYTGFPEKSLDMLQPNFTPFPELITERLLLRKIILADAPAVFYLRSNPHILQHLSKAPAASLKEAEDFITSITNNLANNDGILWGITLKEAPDKVIGTICYWRLDKDHYRAEIGYALTPAFWRKGIMKEAILKVLDYGYNSMGLHSIEGRISPENIASASILEATGFIREAYFREDFFYNGKFEDTAVYSRLQQ